MSERSIFNVCKRLAHTHSCAPLAYSVSEHQMRVSRLPAVELTDDCDSPCGFREPGSAGRATCAFDLKLGRFKVFHYLRKDVKEITKSLH